MVQLSENFGPVSFHMTTPFEILCFWPLKTQRSICPKIKWFQMGKRKEKYIETALNYKELKLFPFYLQN
jgi:hypothetical protein